MSSGGAAIIGPFSYLNAGRIDKQKMTRSVAMSPRLTAEQKVPVITAVNMAMSPGEIAVGYKLDVGSLLSGNFTWGEILSQTLAATADAAVEAAAGYALYNTMTKDSHDSQSVTVNGNNNAVNYNNGTGNSNTGTTTTGNNNNIPGGDYNEK
jgi:hypothetical protein